ncbi:MAG: hypothetical protein MOGMAGMI_02315 [Candidatus Omnitrophica bacterium]|nr:hypothetical protein [Candidatus Omnitrophota bacterium]
MKKSITIRRLTVAIFLFIAGIITAQVYQAGVRYGERTGREAYFERVVMSIYEVEGADRAAVPFGIGSVNCAGFYDCKRVAYNTVKNNWSRWEAADMVGERGGGETQMRKKEIKKPTIEALAAILKKEDDTPIRILPNGQVFIGGRRTKDKPITLKENLGGEYAVAA